MIWHTVFQDGSHPGRDFILKLESKDHTKRLAARFLNVLGHLAFNETHNYFKQWEGDIMQITVGDFRLMAARYHAIGKRHLTTLYGFEKHHDQTPPAHANETRRLYGILKKERRLE